MDGAPPLALALAVWTALIVLFLMFPILLIALYAFNESNVQSWPLDGPLDEVVLLDVPRRGDARGAVAERARRR